MAPGDLRLSDRDFARVRRRVNDSAGISLSESKRSLVASRLAKLVRSLGLASFEAYLDRLESGTRPGDAQDFINALTTNLTRFYREEHHFVHLCGHIRGVLARPVRRSADGRPRVRIWSAGCSTGQEPYTIAMALLAALPELSKCDFRILATDIDTAVLARAATGLYPAADLAGLTADRAAQFESEADGAIRVPAAARRVVTFKPLNLVSEWPMRGPFDAIFCRNVAIYFDRPTQVRLFSRLGDLITAEGYLYIGHSEMIAAAAARFELTGRTIYRLRQAQTESAA